jgi:hypothetical protein
MDTSILDPSLLMDRMHFAESVSELDDLVARIILTRTSFYNAVATATDRYLSRYVSLYDGEDGTSMSENRRLWAERVLGDVQQAFRGYIYDLVRVKELGGYPLDQNAALHSSLAQLVNVLNSANNRGGTSRAVSERLAPSKVFIQVTSVSTNPSVSGRAQGSASANGLLAPLKSGLTYDVDGVPIIPRSSFVNSGGTVSVSPPSITGSYTVVGGTQTNGFFGGTISVNLANGLIEFGLSDDEDFHFTLSQVLQALSDGESMISAGPTLALPTSVVNAARQVAAYFSYVTTIGINPIVDPSRLPT